MNKKEIYTRNWFSKLFFYYINKLIDFGSKNEFDTEDMPQSEKFLNYFNQKKKFLNYIKKNYKRSLKQNICYYVFSKWILLLIGILISNILNLILPIFLKNFILSFTTSNLNNSLIYGSLLFLILFIKPFISQNSTLFGFKCTNRLFSIISIVISDKINKLSNKSRANIDIGKLSSFLTIDIQRIIISALTFHLIFISPILIIINLIILSLQIQYYSLIAPGLLIIIIGMLYLIILPIKRLSQLKLKYSDRRSILINEIIEGIKIIKMNAWEVKLINKIFDIRKNEKKVIKIINFIKQFQDGIINILPSFIGFAVLSIFFFNNGTLNEGAIFYVILTFNLFVTPLKFLLLGLINFFEANNALNRYNEFYNLEENKNLENENLNLQNNSLKNGELLIKGSFGYYTKDLKFNLNKNEDNNKIKNKEKLNINHDDIDLKNNKNFIKDIDLFLNNGQFFGIIGKVGSGKSSILKIFLNELKEKDESSYFGIKGSISYVPQESFLINDTLKNNILFGNEYNRENYREVLNICQLENDLKILPQGDLTEIGERGINLSGGQKQRISIARAIYNNSDIYLIDDALSALDADVAQKIFNEVFIEKLKNNNKTILLATHSINFLYWMDKIIILEEGKIKNQGSYNDLLKNDKDFSNFLKAHINIKNHEVKKQMKTKQMKQNKKMLKKTSMMKDKLDLYKIRQMTWAKSNIFKSYWKYGSITIFIFYVILNFIFSILKLFSDYWVTLWSTNSLNLTNGQYFLYYSIIIIVIIVLRLLGSYWFGIYTGTISYNIFTELINKIINKKLSFFDTTQIGQILNLTNKDMDFVDINIPESLGQLLTLGLNLVGTIVFIFVNNVLIIPIFTIGFGIMIYWVIIYIRVSIKLRKIVQDAYSPLLSNLTELLNGYSSFKVYNKLDYQIKKFDKNSSIVVNILHLERLSILWINFRLEIIVSILIGIYIYLVILGFYLKFSFIVSNINLVGLSLSYSILIITYINILWFFSAETVKGMSSVERIIYKVDDDNKETNLDSPLVKKNNWLQDNTIKIENLNVKYRNDLPNVLKDLNFIIKNNEKCGLVGRTGSGKSTFILAIMRMLENEGKIEIDEVDIKNIGLHILRKNLLLIPQDPFIIQGTLRENIDILKEYDDNTIRNILKEIFDNDLNNFSKDKNGNSIDYLDFEIDFKGKNLSFGQRQLINISRVLLGNNRILLMDEATSNIDFDWDKKIQNIIKEKYKNSLVITIAHRINTIIGYDKIIFLKEGEIMEIGSPKDLLDKKGGHFYNLVKENGDEFFDKLKNIANNK